MVQFQLQKERKDNEEYKCPKMGTWSSGAYGTGWIIDAAMKYYDKTQFGRDRTPGDPQRFYNVNSLVWRCGAAGVRALPVLTAHDISLPEQ